MCEPRRRLRPSRCLDACIGHPSSRYRRSKASWRTSPVRSTHTRGHLWCVPHCAFMALVFQRPGEVRQAEWTEFDLDASTWRIPAGRMKRTKAGKAEGPDHEVPLSTQAVAVLRELHPLTGNGRHVFPSLRKGDRPMSDNAVLTALRTMGFPKEEMTGHGFRAMARTMLAERLDVDEQVIEAQLAHAVQGSLGRAYNRTQFMERRRTMMQLWADYLDGLRHSPTQAARLVKSAAAKDQLSDRKRV